MAKAEWGTKRTCPKCSKRFYDLGKFDLSKQEPLRCIECGHEWKHEPILKTKQPNVPEAKAEKPAETEEDIFLEADDDDDDAVEANNDDDVTVETLDSDNEDVATIVDAPIEKPTVE